MACETLEPSAMAETPLVLTEPVPITLPVNVPPFMVKPSDILFEIPWFAPVPVVTSPFATNFPFDTMVIKFCAIEPTVVVPTLTIALPSPVIPVPKLFVPDKYNSPSFTIAECVVSSMVTPESIALEFSPVILIKPPSAVSSIFVIFKFVRYKSVSALQSSKPVFKFISSVDFSLPLTTPVTFKVPDATAPKLSETV